ADKIDRSDVPVYVVSYDSIYSSGYNFLSKLLDKKFDQVIFDEIHKAKNPKSRRTKLSILLADNIDNRLLMSATPITNDLLDIWSQFRLLDKGKTFGTNFYVFRNRYFNSIINKYGKIKVIKYFPKYRTKLIISEAIKKNGIRFKKQDCLDLPPKSYETLYVKLQGEQNRIYHKLSHGLSLEEFNFNLSPSVLVKYEKLQQVTSGFLYDRENNKIIEFNNPKLDIVKTLLPAMTVDDNKTIIFCKYKYELELYSKALKEYSPLVISGETPNKEKICHAFNTDPKHKVVVVQISCGIGISLTAASNVIYVSNTFSYADRYQSEDRAHRMGQTKKTSYYDIVALATIDERVLQILNSKRSRIETVVDRKEGCTSAL
ncbi:MAG: DEAD/DEAH box helicase, partial [Thermoplasmata archaeon]